MIPDNGPILLIASNEQGTFAFLRTKTDIIRELDNYFSEGGKIMTPTESLVVGGKILLLTNNVGELSLLAICMGRDVTEEILSEAKRFHDRLHNN